MDLQERRTQPKVESVDSTNQLLFGAPAFVTIKVSQETHIERINRYERK